MLIYNMYKEKAQFANNRFVVVNFLENQLTKSILQDYMVCLIIVLCQ